MRLPGLILLFLLAAQATAAQAEEPTGPTAPSLSAARWDPTADYIITGQDEAGYRRWYGEASYRPLFVATFHRYLEREGVAGVLPTWQLLRTASAWQSCGAQPFEVPPQALWANLVETLRFIHFHVVPAIGAVEAVSVYRGPALNICAEGAPESAHLELGAVDLVPLRPTDRETLVGTLCVVHSAAAHSSRAGLGFYRGLRFHIDSQRFRRWGADGNGATACGRPSLPVSAAQSLEAPIATFAPPGPPAANRQ